MNTVDTIAAVATPPGEGGVGAVRISGPDVWRIADRMFHSPQKPSEKEGGSFLFGKIISSDGLEIDKGLCLIFRAPRSYTGEDTVEFQGHGGPVVMKQILRCALDAGARSAEPGEFTKRAFLNGKIDLVQAEAVADLIHARSDRAAVAALEQLEGSLSGRFNELYDQLVDVAADLETTLDFVEDELPDTVFPTLGKKMEQIFEFLEDLLSTWDEGRLLREGVRVVIMGRPNAGKSTLFNALLGTDRAIVTEIAGTTRDVLEEGLALNGILVRILDTAGLREAECEIEREGIRRAREHAGVADIAVYLIDSSQPFSKEDEEYLMKLNPDRTVVVLNKTDKKHSDFNFGCSGFHPVSTSLLGGNGVDTIRSEISEKLGGAASAPARAVISERHRNLLVCARDELSQVRERLTGLEDEGIVLAAEHLRSALEYLGQVTGRVYHDELLDNVFSRFCIGK